MRLSLYNILFSTTAIACTAVNVNANVNAAVDHRQQRLGSKSKSLRRPNQPNIETREVGPGLFSISVPPTADHIDAGRRRRRRRKLEEHKSCVLLLEDVYYHKEDPKNVEEKWVCTIDDYVSEDGGVPAPYSFYLDGDIDQINQFLADAKIQSATHTLNWDSADFVTLDEDEDTMTLHAQITENQQIGLWIEPINNIVFTNGSDDRRLRSLQSTKGSKKTLVIRIVGGGVGPSDDLVQIREEVFDNEVGLRSQMGACSHRQLLIEPFNGKTKGGVFKGNISGGVVELRIETNPHGTLDKKMENVAIGAAWQVFGDLQKQMDLVVFVMPPGIQPDFAAYAYIGTPLSFFSDQSIRDSMIQMHEIGHNLGLQHSGEGGEEYGDSSGYMGYTEKIDPIMCYNAVNNYQLGWYSVHSFNPITYGIHGDTFSISGVHRYNPNDSEKFVSVRLVQDSLPQDYYIGYNKAEGINSETQEGGDKVIVFSKDGDTHESVLSWKLAELSLGEMYIIQDFDNSGSYVTITFLDVVDHAAVVEVLPESSQSPTATPMPSNSPSMKPSYRPSSIPSPVPTTGPSDQPSFAPTNEPSESPSLAPTKKPTDGPTSFPTKSFSPSISAKPSSSPSDRPSSSPSISSRPTISAMPSSDPSVRPSSTPTISAAPSISTRPSSSPSENPTYSPTSSPSSSPTEFVCADDISLTITVRTDGAPEDTSWKLRVVGSETIAHISEYQKSFETHDYAYCLEYATCYRFSIFDEGGDGFSTYPDNFSDQPGIFTAKLGGKVKARHRGDWGSRRSYKICTNPDPFSVLGDELAIGEETNNVPEIGEIEVELSDASETEVADSVHYITP